MLHMNLRWFSRFQLFIRDRTSLRIRSLEFTVPYRNAGAVVERESAAVRRPAAVAPGAGDAGPAPLGFRGCRPGVYQL